MNIAEALRRHIGRGQRLSVDQASQLTGISEAVIRGHMAEVSSPNMANLQAYLQGLGVEFQLDLLAPLGVVPVGAEDIGHSVMTADAAVMTAHLSQALADGVVDHKEKAILWPEALEVGQKLISWALQQRADLDRLRR